MWIRSGIWEGTTSPENLKIFTKAIEEDMVPALRELPGVRAVRVLWPRYFENRAADMFCQSLVEFDDRAGIEAMLASPRRLGPRERVHALQRLFDGRLSHIEYEVL